MKLLALIDLTLVLAVHSKGGTDAHKGWIVSTPRRINATLGSNVTINCSFKYPPEQHTDKVQVFWKRKVRSDVVLRDKDRNEFIYHPDALLVVEKYRGKTTLIGNVAEGDCALRISNVMENEPAIYVRLATKDDTFSFYSKAVFISVSGTKEVLPDQGNTSVPPFLSPAVTNMTTNLETATVYLYTAIFSPLCVLLVIIVVVVAVLCLLKSKRSQQALTREDTGYYANFSRGSADPAPRAAPCKIQENKKLSQPKIIDDPIYANTEALTVPMPEDHLHNVYANVAHLS